MKVRYIIEPCARSGSFTAMQNFFPTSTINKADAVRTLDYAEASTINPKLKKLADEVLKTEPVTALLIWRKGKILFENYQYDRKQQICSYPSQCTKP